MCGISGFVDFSKSTQQSTLEKMNRTMGHRGPDGEGYSIFNNNLASIGLGHRRLSIIDLSEGGKQPKTFGHLHITFNGEVYNYAEIKSRLIEKGHQFESQSDTEVILHAYSEWGADAVNQFIGMFAFVIYDEKNNKIFACRDRAGVKPFFYYFIDGLFLFASELKAILQHPNFVKGINIDAVAAYMQFGYVPTPHCIFNNTYKLKPGNYFTVDLQSPSISTIQYWSVYDAYNQPELKIDFPEALEETEKLLTNAFQYRMVSDVPVGIFLSGGYDSSCVTALLQKNNPQQLKTFTIGVPDAGLNEAPFAKTIAEKLGTDHTEYYCTEKEAIEIVPTLPFYYDEPFADSSAIPTMLVSKIAKEKVTVALSADGGDEIFAGYNRYDYAEKYGKRIQQIPSIVRKGTGAVMDIIPANAIPYFNKKSLFHSRYEKLKSLLKNPSEENMLMSLTAQMNTKDLDNLFKAKTNRISSYFNSKELNPERFSTLAYNMATDYQTYLLDDILQKVDRAGMSASLEGREPFLDHRIIEWAAKLPMNFKYNKGNKKFIIKEIVHKYLPKDLMERPKMGFGIPVAAWLLKDLKPFVDQYLDEEFIAKQQIFNNEEVQRIRKNFYQGKIEKGEKIWYMLMFQMWYDKWINNN